MMNLDGTDERTDMRVSVKFASQQAEKAIERDDVATARALYTLIAQANAEAGDRLGALAALTLAVAL